MFENLFLPDIDEESSDFLPIFSMDEDEESNKTVYEETMPLLALKNTVLFPGIIIPITAGRDKSIKAIQEAYNHNKIISVVSQKASDVENPGIDDLYSVGTVAKIIKLIKMPDGTTTAIIQGKERFQLNSIVSDEPFMTANITILEHIQPKNTLQFDALISSIRDVAKKIIKLNPNIPTEASVMFKNITKNSFLLNFISSNLGIETAEKQNVLEINALDKKAMQIYKLMDNELKLLELKHKIENKVKGDIEKQQKEYFLNQQLRTIQDELGQNPSEETFKELEARAEEKKWTKKVGELFFKELNKARRLNPAVAEYSVALNYLETLLDLPWEEFTEDNFDLKSAQQVLDSRHHGLEKVKDRIIEHLAILKLKKDMKAPILCLVGPPGVGKTSLGRSIAEALGREYVRMSFGGLHDESEIRGHRKTYIGAMPGRIIQNLKKAGSGNPVFILDEIDKIGKDHRGDPSSALLEVLDPEQNSTFHDNFLEVEYDLSNVLFIATANSLNTIQPALRDRMEIIHVSGYSVEEKVEIASKHLVKEQIEAHGLKKSHVKIGKKVLKKIVREYTRESGVRSLKRKIASVMRHYAKLVAMEEEYTPSITEEKLEEILGKKPFSNDLYTQLQPPGVAVGLAWTSVGGDILFIECSLSKGKGKLTLTGNLGNVMKESATTALSYIKSNSEELGIDPEKITNSDIHIHVPEGAIPKDGPSAGITMTSALVSALLDIPLKSHVAMTGETTLRGKVLPVGGIKEKVLAAKRAGLKTIILCGQNEKDVDEIPDKYLKGIKFKYVDTIQDVIEEVI